MSLNPSKIEYIRDAEKPIEEGGINRLGRVLNICTGCKHNCEYCYARRMVMHGRLKGHPSYPYGFEPTFHPERIRKYGGKPKLIFLNDMGDVGGDWEWIDPRLYHLGKQPSLSPEFMAHEMRHFALLNPQHIILLLTKNPSWYGLVAEWPPNVYCGFTATTNEELEKRWYEIRNAFNLEEQTGPRRSRIWLSAEPWLDDKPPNDIAENYIDWIAVGGQSGPNARPVSEATLEWLMDDTVQARRFTKENALYKSEYWERSLDDVRIEDCPREYPADWGVE